MISKDWIIVGKFGRPHGLKGLVTIVSHTEPRENILRYLPWYIRKNNEWHAINIEHVETNNKAILARVEGYVEREEVAALTNLEIGVSVEQLPALNPGEYYWHQLIGMQVINQDGKILGKVTDIMPTGSNDVLVVTGEERYLIPYIEGVFVLEINKEKESILVDWDMDFA